MLSGVDGDTLILTGTGFSLTLEDNLVLMGGVNCSVTAATATQLTCTVGEGPAGEHNVSVTVDQKGLAEHQGGTYSFTYNYEVTGISPSAGSLGGIIFFDMVHFTYQFELCGVAFITYLTM